MKLTESQVANMQAQGLSLQQIEQVAQSKGYQMPDNRDLLQKTSDIVGSIFAGQKVGEAIGTLGGYGLTKASEATGLPIAPGGKYGFHRAEKGESQYYDLSAPSPLQVAGDIGLGATQIAGARLPVAKSILGKTAIGATMGGFGGTFEGIADAKSIDEIAYQAGMGMTVGGLIGLTFGVAEKGIKLLSQGTQATGEKIQMRVIRPQKVDFEDGFDVKNIKKYNLGGSLEQTLDKADKRLEELNRQLTEKLASSNNKVNLKQVYARTAQQLLDKQKTTFGQNTQIQNGIGRLKSEITGVAGPSGMVNLPEAQIVKRASGHMGAWKFGMTDPESTANVKIYNTFYHELKKEIEKQSPAGVQAINKEMSDIIPIMNAVIRRIPAEQRAAAVSFPDLVTLGLATVDPRALGLTAINILGKSGRFGSLLTGAGGGAVSNTVNRAGQIAQPFIPTIGSPGSEALPEQ